MVLSVISITLVVVLMAACAALTYQVIDLKKVDAKNKESLETFARAMEKDLEKLREEITKLNKMNKGLIPLIIFGAVKGMSPKDQEDVLQTMEDELKKRTDVRKCDERPENLAPQCKKEEPDPAPKSKKKPVLDGDPVDLSDQIGTMHDGKEDIKA